MAQYLLIEASDPFASNEVGYYCELARGLVEAGNRVTLFLVQNAVLAARPLAQTPQLHGLVGSGVKILADDFSLRERGITNVLDGVEIASIESVVDALAAGHKVLCH
jgi:sulfur relay (sulfurtransferase) complex TusBCD TusD component (DsrE family)